MVSLMIKFSSYVSMYLNLFGTKVMNGTRPPELVVKIITKGDIICKMPKKYLKILKNLEIFKLRQYFGSC